MMKLIHDLSEEIMELQRQIIRTKAVTERVQLGMEMNEKNRLLVRNTIRLANPEISEKEISAKYFELYYGYEFSLEQKKAIINGILS